MEEGKQYKRADLQERSATHEDVADKKSPKLDPHDTIAAVTVKEATNKRRRDQRDDAKCHVDPRNDFEPNEARETRRLKLLPVEKLSGNQNEGKLRFNQNENETTRRQAD